MDNKNTTGETSLNRVNCPECDKRVDDRAVACPNCGAKIYVEHPGGITPTRHRPESGAGTAE